MKKLFRDTKNGWIGGVCSGLAAYFGVSVTMVRLLFFFGQAGGLYILLWIFVPKDEQLIY